MEIRADGISVTLGRREIIKNLSLALSEREFVVLIGLNGAGKTTLMKALMGFLPLAGGRVTYDGADLSGIPVNERAKLIAYMPQRPEQRAEYSALEFVMMGAAPYLGFFEKPGKRERGRAEEILSEYSVRHLKDRRMCDISAGEAQLMYIARADMQGAKWLILDEPTASLDYLKQRWLMGKLKSFAEKSPMGILISVHYPDFALEFADMVLVMDNGGRLSRVGRAEGDFEERLTEELNRVYGGKLTLMGSGGAYMYFWNEKGGM